MLACRSSRIRKWRIERRREAEPGDGDRRGRHARLIANPFGRLNDSGGKGETMSIFSRFFGKGEGKHQTSCSDVNQRGGSEKVEGQDTQTNDSIQADQRIILNALASADLARVKDVLERGGAVNVVLPDGFESATPLVFATGMLVRYPEFVEILLQYGGDPNLSTREGRTALFVAAGQGSTEIAKTLIENGADVSAGNLQRGFTALYHAVENGHHDMVKLLIEKGADVNVQVESGWTPLHRAVINGDISMAALLVDKGANVNAIETYSNTTPLSQAIERNHSKIVELLKKHGANSAEGEPPVTVESLARNGVYCRNCDTRYSIDQVIEPYVSNQKYVGYKCRKCLVNVIYDPEQDRCF